MSVSEPSSYKCSFSALSQSSITHSSSTQPHSIQNFDNNFRETLHEQTQFLKNVAIFGALSFIGSKGSSKKPAQAPEPKKTQPQKGQGAAPAQAAKPA